MANNRGWQCKGPLPQKDEESRIIQPKVRMHGRIIVISKDEFLETMKGIFQGHDRLCLFLGAGISRNSGLPLASDLQVEIALSLWHRTGSASQLQDKQLAILFRDNGITLELMFELMSTTISNRALEPLTLFRDGQPDWYHAVVAMLLHERPNTYAITTNFDCLIEKASKSALQVAFDEQSISSQHETTPLYKIHGTAEHLESVTATISEMTKGLSAGKATLLQHTLETAEMIFLGWEGRDIDLTPVIEKSAHKRILWFVYQNDGFEAWSNDSPGFEEFLARTAPHLQSMLSGGQSTVIACNPEKILRQLVSNVEVTKGTPPAWREVLNQWAKSLTVKEAALNLRSFLDRLQLEPETIAVLEAAIEHDPEDYELRMLCARHCRYEERYNEAFNHFNLCLRKRGLPPVQANLATVVNEALTRTDCADILVELAGFLQKSGNIEAAMQLLALSLTHEPSATVQLRLARLLVRQGHLREARTLLPLAIKTAEQIGDPLLLLEAFTLETVCQISSSTNPMLTPILGPPSDKDATDIKDRLALIMQYADVLGNRFEIVEAFIQIAESSIHIREFAAAAEAASEAVERSNSLVALEGYRGKSAYAGALNTLGVAKKELALHNSLRGESGQFMKNLQEAVEAYDKAVFITKGAEHRNLAIILSKALTNRGWARAALGETDTAEIDLRYAICLKEKHGDTSGLIAAYENLAGVVRQQGNHNEADVLLREAIRLRSGGDYQGGKTWHKV